MQFVTSPFMKPIKTLIKTAALLIPLYCANTWAEAKVDVNALANKCVACHGEKGISSNSDWPNLAGQKRGYLIKEITAFREGTRKNSLMSPMVQHLNDSEVFALAEYFSTQINVTKAKAQENINGKHVRARCISCHGMKGFTVNDLWPNLAGQKKSYLQKQLIAFKSGIRKSPIMEVIAKELDEKQIADVAEYFSQQPSIKK